MVDTIEILPSTHGIVSLIPLDELELPLHSERNERKRLVKKWLGDHKVRVGQQQIVGTQDQIVRARLGIDALAELHPKVLDRRWLILIHHRQSKRFFRDLEVGFKLKRRHH